MNILLICISFILLLPDYLFAWGGGMHLQTAVSILANLHKISPEIAGIISSFPNDFLYGNIAADITVGKKFTHYMLNCHRWNIGRKIFKEATTDSEIACACGYLTHLAADVIAHNYYVPYKIMRSFPTVTMKHTYWEMRFETFIDQSIWGVADRVCKSDQKSNDIHLRKLIAPTLFSFGTNKKIFNSIMLLSRLEKWQSMMKTLSESSRYQLSDEDKEEYVSITEAFAYRFLADLNDEKILMTDPTGEDALKAAEAVRKNLRILYKSGKITKEEGFSVVEKMKDKLRLSIENRDVIREIYLS